MTSEDGGQVERPRGEEPPEAGPGAASRPDGLGRARRTAIEALSAYRSATDASGLAAVFQSLAGDLPAHWVVAGLLSVSSQLVDYLAVSEKVDPDDILRALASLEVEEELGGRGEEDDTAG